jgi:uncharacterized protein YbbK (DUF523 family)
VCPEVEIGLGIPRDTLRLVGSPEAPRLVQEKTGEDLTATMQRYAEDRVRALAALDLDGYVLKRASPSCGLFRVRVHRDNGIPAADGRGLFAAALTTALPAVPVEEEGRLTDPVIRENFIERVFLAARWRAFVAARPRPPDLVAFHAAHKLAVLAHSPAHYARLGRMVAATGRVLGRAQLEAYHTLLMEAFAVRATRGRHANVLQHAAGYFTSCVPPGSSEPVEEDDAAVPLRHDGEPGIQVRAADLMLRAGMRVERPAGGPWNRHAAYRSGRPPEQCRHLVPRPVIETAAPRGRRGPAPLLVEERDSVLPADVT